MIMLALFSIWKKMTITHAYCGKLNLKKKHKTKDFSLEIKEKKREK